MNTAMMTNPESLRKETWGEVNQDRVKVDAAINTIKVLQNLQQK